MTQTVTQQMDYNSDGIIDETITSIQDTKQQSDNDILQSGTRDLIDFTEIDPFSENKY
jgi:hypothetical protein